MAGSDASVLCLCSLACCSLFVWFQCAVELKLPEGYTHVHLSLEVHTFLGRPSAHLCSPEQASGSHTVAVDLLGLLTVTTTHSACASSPGCSAVFSLAGGLLLWADWPPWSPLL